MARIIKIGLAALALTVGTLAVGVATTGINEAPTLVGGSSPSSERTVTVNMDNRLLGCKENGSVIGSSLAFPLSDGLAYNLIYTTQRQVDLKDSDNAVLVLWNHNNLLCEFTINTNMHDGEKITHGDKTLTCVKFNRLTQIDIKLNKDDEGKRVLELTSEVNGDTKGVFTVIADTSSYIQYSWKPDNSGGYITTTDKVTFGTPTTNNGKAIWVTDLIFHYTC